MLKPKLKTKIKENKTLKKNIESVGKIAAKSPHVKVGYPLTAGGGMKYPHSNVPVASVAFWNEFGTVRMPARPFFRPTMSKNAKKYRQLLAQAAKDSLAGKKDLFKGMRLIGLKAVSDIQMAIVSIKDPANSPRTIAMKRSGNPLIDTGFMRSSTTFELVKRK